jgi:chemotaxis protein MotB
MHVNRKIHSSPSHAGLRPRAFAPRPLSLSSAAPAGDDGNWWVITLSDLTLLLLGFMAVWYATTSAKPTPAPKLPEAAASQPPGATVPAEAPSDGEVWRKMGGELLAAVKAAGFADEVTVESMPNELVISLRDTIPFASGKADLRSRALPVLEKVVAIILRDGALSVAIGGHTDSLRIATPEFPSNWELSTARASRVARYLIEHGVHPTRIAVEGYASFRPRGPNSNALNRSINRRVEIRLFHDNAAPATNALPHP